MDLQTMKREVAAEIKHLTLVYRALSKNSRDRTQVGSPGDRKPMSAEAREKIAAAQRARWAKVRNKKPKKKASPRPVEAVA